MSAPRNIQPLTPPFSSTEQQALREAEAAGFNGADRRYHAALLLRRRETQEARRTQRRERDEARRRGIDAGTVTPLTTKDVRVYSGVGPERVARGR